MRLFPKDIIKKSKKDKLIMLTAYDSTFARIVDDCDVDMILVGDSLGMVVQGKENTLEVTLDEIIYHTKCVVRGSKKALVIADMPFLSYQSSVSQAVLNCGRALKEGGAQCVKMEGGLELVETVKTVVDVGIPVIAHIGLRPQSINQQGGYKIQGKDSDSANDLIETAKEMEKAGAFLVLMEGVEPKVAKQITDELNVPTVGIASGKNCSGQVLVIYDVLGLNPDFKPSFVKQYLDGYSKIKKAITLFAHEVKNKNFPK